MPTPAKPPLSDEYCVLLIAAGPGLAFCAAGYWFAEGDVWQPERWLALPNVYFAFLLTSLPGLLPLAFCLSRALPRRPDPFSVPRFLAWLAVALLAPFWHLAILELSYWLVGAGSAFGWSGWYLLGRYGFG